MSGEYKSYKLTSVNDKEEVIACTKALDLSSAAIKFELCQYNVNKTSKIKTVKTEQLKKGKSKVKKIKELIVSRNVWACSQGEFKKLKQLSINYNKGVYHLV